MAGVLIKKRLIPYAVLRHAARDALVDAHKRSSNGAQVADILAQHMAGIIDAHCILLQRALCIHCGNDVPLVFVEKWGEHLHNGELTCIAGTAREIMGVEPETLHDGENYYAR